MKIYTLYLHTDRELRLWTDARFFVFELITKFCEREDKGEKWLVQLRKSLIIWGYYPEQLSSFMEFLSEAEKISIPSYKNRLSIVVYIETCMHYKLSIDISFNYHSLDECLFESNLVSPPL